MNEFFAGLKKILKSYHSVEISRGIDMPCLGCSVDDLLSVFDCLYHHEQVQATMLLDICVVDLLHYGCDEWVGSLATSTGFERARNCIDVVQSEQMNERRFIVTYHVMSVYHNQRFRLKVLLDDVEVLVPSVTAIWPNANWYEREAFDLFGVRFSGHPGLRRILTDYGFIGYPMRKDFPLQGKVEMRYDAALEQCVYAPVEIENRVSVPKVIRRDDDRYLIKD